MLQSSRSSSKRQRLERALIDANHREQQRLSHELHDGLGQDLAGLAYLANAVAKKAERTQSLLAGEISALSGLALHAVEACHNIARGISPLTDSDGSLIAALRQTVERANAGGRVRAEFRVSDRASLTLPLESLNQLYRIAQEALNNARMGLDSMRYRAAAMGAHLSIENRGTHGVVVTCECHQTPFALRM